MGRGNKYFLICKLWYLQAADPWLWLAGLSVAEKGRAFPSPEAGEVGRGQMHLRYLISTV